VYACLQIAMCESIHQWGFDETSLDGAPCFNQWCLLINASGPKIVSLECAGVLPSSSAAETVEHIQKTWERGQAVVELVREELGLELQDILAPLIEGGVKLHKIFGLMHDTCATANLVAELMARLRDEKGKEFYGEDVWDGKENKAKPMFDFCVGIIPAISLLSDSKSVMTNTWKKNLAMLYGQRAQLVAGVHALNVRGHIFCVVHVN
jgi:hypothetical protein